MCKVSFVFILSLILLSCKENSPTFYSLNVSVTPENTGFVTPTQDTLLEENSSISVTAIANEGYSFIGWSGDISSTENPVNLTITDDVNITANFQIKTYSLTTVIVGEGEVTETVIQAKKDYEHGTLVRLESIPDTGWSFVRWEGDVESEESVLEILIEEEKNLRAVFEQTIFPFSINIVGNGTVQNVGFSEFEDVYLKGTELILIGIPDTMWVFQGWNNTTETDSDTLKIIINSEINLSVNFREGVLDFCVPIRLDSYRIVSETDSIFVLDWDFKYDKSFRYITSYNKEIDFIKTGEWPRNLAKAQLEYENGLVNYVFMDFEGADHEYFFTWSAEEQLIEFTNFHYQTDYHTRFKTESISYSDPCGFSNIYGKETQLTSPKVFNNTSIYDLTYTYENGCNSVSLNTSNEVTNYSNSESIFRDIKGVNGLIGWSYEFLIFNSPPIFRPNPNQGRLESIEAEVYIRESRQWVTAITTYQYSNFIFNDKYPRYFISLNDDPREETVAKDSYLVQYYCGYK